MNISKINNDQVLDLLILASPSFKEYLAEELDEDSRKLDYIVAGTFAQYLLSLYKKNDIKDLPAVANFLEELHTKGTHEVKELATIGYLEGIQNVWGNNGIDPQIFYQYLLPESKKWWNQLDKFWRGEIKYVGETYEMEN